MDLMAMGKQLLADKMGDKAGGMMEGLSGLTGGKLDMGCLLYTSPSPRDGLLSRMPSSA